MIENLGRKEKDMKVWIRFLGSLYTKTTDAFFGRRYTQEQPQPTKKTLQKEFQKYKNKETTNVRRTRKGK